MKLTDLIKPEHVAAAFRKFDSLPEAEGGKAVDAHIEKLIPLARVISGEGVAGMDFAVTMTAVSIIDLAIQEATAEKLT